MATQASPTSINCKHPATGPATIWKNGDGCSRGAKSVWPAVARARRCQKRDAKRARASKIETPGEKGVHILDAPYCRKKMDGDAARRLHP